MKSLKSRLDHPNARTGPRAENSKTARQASKQRASQRQWPRTVGRCIFGSRRIIAKVIISGSAGKRAAMHLRPQRNRRQEHGFLPRLGQLLEGVRDLEQRGL